MALSKIRSDSMTDAAIQSNRNLIINGEHKVSQRGTSFTAQGANGQPYFTDRWNVFSGGASAGRFTATQEAITDLAGFKYALKLDCTTADTSIGADEQLSIIQTIEAQNLQHLKFGTSDAVSLTYSFFAKANAAKTYIAELYTADSLKSQSHAFTVTTSWQRFEITFSATGADAATINNDNGQGMFVLIDIHAGSNLTSGTINSTWAAATQANRMVGCGSFYSSTDNTFFMTGAQLEIGDVATPFEHEDIGTTLRKCRRYYQKLVGTSYYGGFHAYTGSTGIFVQLVPSMRAAPAVTNYNVRNASSGATASNQSAAYINVDGFVAPIDGAGGADTNVSHINQAFLEASAEL